MPRVLIVDDSPVIQQFLERELGKVPGFDVVGSAADPYRAREMIAATRPDAITLDIEMPRMNGIAFLRRLMRHFPLPVVIVSSQTRAGVWQAERALASGAVAVVQKPHAGYPPGQMLRDLVRALAPETMPSPGAVELAGSAGNRARVIAIGASTGGSQAIERVLRDLPDDCPGVVAVQHMPPGFTRMFAERLAETLRRSVQEATDGAVVRPRTVLIAPGDRHLVLGPAAADGLYRVATHSGPPVNSHRPSVDVLFHSVAQNAGPGAVGVLLTGMGNDGARGLLEMRRSGAPTLAQDQASSAVFGMPRAAIELNAAQAVVGLDHMAKEILRRLRASK